MKNQPGISGSVERVERGGSFSSTIAINIYSQFNRYHQPGIYIFPNLGIRVSI